MRGFGTFACRSCVLHRSGAAAGFSTHASIREGLFRLDSLKAVAALQEGV